MTNSYTEDSPSSPAPFIGCDRKPAQYYKGLRLKTDTDLHPQLVKYLRDTGLLAGGKKLRVLDCGAGEGALSLRLHDLGCEVISVDIDADSFKAQGPKFFRLDLDDSAALDKFIAEHGGFDLILCVEVIEHIKNPWQLLTQLRKLCGEHTRLIVSTPNVSSWWSRFWFLLKGELWGFDDKSWRDIGHINPITEMRMQNILRETGFERAHVFPCGVLPVIWLYNWKRALISLAMLPVYFIMRGYKNGWVLCFDTRKTD